MMGWRQARQEEKASDSDWMAYTAVSQRNISMKRAYEQLEATHYILMFPCGHTGIVLAKALDLLLLTIEMDEF